MDTEQKEISEGVGATHATISVPTLAIYTAAKNDLGKHITLNPQVPPDVGCAEAASVVLKTAGIPGIPATGFASTFDLYEFMLKSGKFKQSTSYTQGAIIISPSGTSSKGSPHGHVGICGVYGILSNDSNTGLFREIWTLDSWMFYYAKTLGFPVFFFEAI